MLIEKGNSVQQWQLLIFKKVASHKLCKLESYSEKF